MELSLALLWTGAYLAILNRWSEAPVFFVSLVFLAFFVMLVTTLTDLDWRIIPDEATLSLCAAGIALAGWNPLLGDVFVERQTKALIGAAVGGGVLWCIGSIGRAFLGREAMGGGDIKLLAAFGAVFGWESAMLTLFLGSIGGALAALVGLLTGRLRRDHYIPFGPFLNAAAALIFFILLERPDWGSRVWMELIPVS